MPTNEPYPPGVTPNADAATLLGLAFDRWLSEHPGIVADPDRSPVAVFTAEAEAIAYATMHARGGA